MKKITVKVEFTVPEEVADAPDLLDRLTKAAANELRTMLQNHYASVDAAQLTTVEVDKR